MPKEIVISDWVYRNLNSYKNVLMPRSLVKKYGIKTLESKLKKYFKAKITIRQIENDRYIAEMSGYETD